MTRLTRQKNAIKGLALGDAWGADHEFLPFETMQTLHDQAWIPQEGQERIRVTDDTHMSLHVYWALDRITADLSYESLENFDQLSEESIQSIIDAFTDEFLEWYSSPLNTFQRSPGNTCMESMNLISRLKENGVPWRLGEETNESMGSGTAMRSPWLGVHPGLPYEAIEPVSSIQSLITHQHREAHPAAALVALLVRELVDGTIESHELLPRAHVLMGERGWDGKNHTSNLLSYFERAEEAQRKMEETGERFLLYDPCSALGGGWIAPSAVALAVTIASTYSRPETALRRAVLTGGDSDTIAAITGALTGAGSSDPSAFDSDFSRMEEPFKSDIEGILDSLDAAADRGAE